MKRHNKQKEKPMTKIKSILLSLFDAKVGKRKKLMVLGIILYIISPIDLIPDFIPVVGYADDIILPILFIIAEKLLTEDNPSEPVRVKKEAERVD